MKNCRTVGENCEKLELKSILKIRPRSGQDMYRFSLQYQGAPKTVWNYVEMGGLQKLQIQSTSLVAIGTNPLDFFPTASPSSHQPHRPPGTGQSMAAFPRTYFFFKLPDTFSRKTFSDRLRTQPIKITTTHPPCGFDWIHSGTHRIFPANFPRARKLLYRV